MMEVLVAGAQGCCPCNLDEQGLASSPGHSI